MTKRKKIVIFVTITIIVCLIGLAKFTEYGNYARWYITNPNERKIESFKEYKNDFQIIASKITKLVKDGKIPKHHSSIFIEMNEMSSGDGEGDTKVIELNEIEKESLKKITKTFNEENYPMAVIGIENSYLSFPVADYALGVIYIYGEDLAKSLDFFKAEYKDFKVNQVVPRWYSVENKSE